MIGLRKKFLNYEKNGVVRIVDLVKWLEDVKLQHGCIGNATSVWCINGLIDEIIGKV